MPGLALVRCALVLSSCTALAAQWRPGVGGQWEGASVALRPEAILGAVFADLDGDGFPELVTTSKGLDGHPVKMWRNDGHGVFREPIPLPADNLHHRTVAALDVDLDGDTDLVAVPGPAGTYARPGSPKVLVNDGRGGFTVGTSLSAVPMLARRIHTRDLNGDGLTDLLVLGIPAHQVATMQLFLAGPSGGLQNVTASNLPSPIPSGEAWSQLIDFDRDGDLDLLVRGDPNPLRLLLNDGSGSFTLAPASAVPQLCPAVAARDLDGDGDVDFVGRLRFWDNPGGSGTWQPALHSGVPLQTARFVDLDGDGSEELVAMRSDASAVVLDLRSGQNETNRWFAPDLRSRAFHPGFFLAPLLSFGDVDRDGFVDLLWGLEAQRPNTPDTHSLPTHLLLNDGGRRFVDGSQRALPELPLLTTSLAAGDLDGDGDIDLWSAQESNVASNDLGPSVWLNDGLAGFTPGPGPHHHGASACALVDVDGDGDLDAVQGFGWSSYTPLTPTPDRLALNDGRASFTDATASRFPALPPLVTTSIAAGDVDGDGDVDLMFGHHGVTQTSTVGARDRLLLNDGTGRFVDGSLGRIPPTNDPTIALHLADVDADGDLDLVAARGPSGAPTDGVRLWENDGTGRFVDVSNSGRIPAVPRVHDLAVADLDGDGDPDIVLPGAELLNDGSGRFVLRPVTRPADVRSLAAGDLGGDGTPGVVSGHEGTVVAPGWESDAARLARYRSLVLADLGGDEDLDLVTATTPRPGARILAGDFGMGVVLNQHRHMQVTGLPRVGRAHRIRYHVPSPTTWSAIPLFGTARRAPGLRIPGIGGSLGIAGVPIVGRGLPLSQIRSIDFTLPADPALDGMELVEQTLFVRAGATPELWLSNVVVGRITF